MANVHCIQQTLQGHHPTDRPCDFVRRYDGVSQRRPTFDTTFFLVVGIIVLTITERVRLGTDIFHVATTWITVYFSLTMSTNVLLSGKYFLCRVSHRQDLHATRCDRNADSPCWKPSARVKFEAALANHIHNHREQCSVYFQCRRRACHLPERFLWAICSGRFDCPGGCKRPVYLVSAL